MKAINVKEAWKIVDEIFPTDYNEDAVASEKAGYKVYRSPINYYDYICDLGDRLEITLHTGKSINVWIEKDFTKEEKRQVSRYIDSFLYHMEDNFGTMHEEELKRYGLDKIMKELNEIYDAINQD